MAELELTMDAGAAPPRVALIPVVIPSTSVRRLFTSACLLAGCAFEPSSVALDGRVPVGDAPPSSADAAAGGDAEAPDATSGPDGVSGPIWFVERVEGVSETVEIAAGIVSVAPDDLYLVAIATKPYTDVAGVSGLGAGWVRVAAQCGARSQTGVVLYRADAPTTSGNVTATLLDNTVLKSVVMVVSRYRGAHPNAPIGSVATYNALDATRCDATDDAVDVPAYTFEVDGATDRMVFAAAATRQNAHEPGAGYVERAELHTGSDGDAAGLAVMDGTAGSPSVVSGTLSADTDVAVVAAELR